LRAHRRASLDCRDRRGGRVSGSGAALRRKDRLVTGEVGRLVASIGLVRRWRWRVASPWRLVAQADLSRHPAAVMPIIGQSCRRLGSSAMVQVIVTIIAG